MPSLRGVSTRWTSAKTAFAKIVMLVVFLATAPAFGQVITHIEISGTINPGSADYIRSALAQSQSLKAEAMIIGLNTPGGLLSSTREIVQLFSTSPIPVVIFVSPGGASATSAGAVLGIAAHLTAMAPGTNIGAAHPVGTGGDDIKSAMGAKVTNDTAAMVRAQAKMRGRNLELAEKIVTESLSFSAEEAKEKNLVNFVATDLDSLLTQLDGAKVFLESKQATVTLVTKGLKAAQLTEVSMSSSQKFLHFIADPNISTMLLGIAGMAFYVEVASGFSMVAPGVIALLLAVIGGVSLSMLPINLAGLFLMGLGAIFFIAEIFVTSFGVLFAAGLIAMGLGALFLIDPNAASIQVSLALLIPMLLGFIVVGGTIAWLLKRDSPKGASTFEPLLGQSAPVMTIDEAGRSGTVKVNGELWNFISDDELKVNDTVVILARNNLQLTVKRRT